MTRIIGEIVIDAPADVVFDFVADQRNEPAYNPHMVRSAKVTPGPVGKGTQFRSAVRSRGRPAEMAIEYTGFQRPSRLASTTRMAQAEFSGTLTFEPAGAGTRLRWSWDARFTWPLRLLAPVLARVGGRQERATWAGLKRYLESSQHAADPRAGEQPGPAPAAAADGNGSQPPGQGRAGAALLAASVAGAALAPLALRRLGRGGSLLVAAGCGALFARDAQMTLTGAPARLRPLPRLLLRTEVPVSGRVGGMGRLDGPLGPLSAAGGLPLRRDRGPPVFGYQTRCRDAYSVEALTAERSRPADGRSRAYPPYLHPPVTASVRCGACGRLHHRRAVRKVFAAYPDRDDRDDEGEHGCSRADGQHGGDPLDSA